MSEPSVKPLPRRGRIWVILGLIVFFGGLGYLVVEMATLEPGDDAIRLEGVNEMQRYFGGIPQEDDRLGSSNAPVTVQVFNDLHSAEGREDFLATMPELAERYARTGEAQFLYRHYSTSENPKQLGYFGAEAAAEQNYLWQYVDLFFANQEQAGHFGLDEEFLTSVAGGVEELDIPEWKAALADQSGPNGALTKRIEGFEELGRDLKIRVGQAAVVSGPGGTVVLQEGPSLAEMEAAIKQVS